MKGEKAEGLSHFRDPKYEGPYSLSLLILTIDQSDKVIFISMFHQ